MLSVGLSERSRLASSRMCGSAKDPATFLSKLVGRWGKASPWHVRIGRARRPRIASSPTNGSAMSDGVVLVLHDTTEFSFQRESSEAIGMTYNFNSGRDKAGRL